MSAEERARDLVRELREIHARSRENAKAQGWGMPPESEDRSPWSQAADLIEQQASVIEGVRGQIDNLDRGLPFAQGADGARVFVQRSRRILSRLDPATEGVQCPHWQPGAITLRTGCTACEASSSGSTGSADAS
ncbi:MAG: hypothetical protein K0Q52_153 [Microbacterium sp.]|jgi:hypothetical protein|nr:hypothetical protein [Microbacterium sp.]